MPKFNEMFELSVQDVALIETALQRSMEELSAEHRECESGIEREESIRQIHALLGKLYNQKIFYRPKEDGFLGG
jgi:type II secretory pathway component PulJ